MIKQKPNGKHQVDIWDEYGKRHRLSFKSRFEAKAFEAAITTKKYDNLLISSNLQNKRYPIEPELNRFEKTKSDLRPGSIKRYKYIIDQIRDFSKAEKIVFLDEFTPDHATLFKEHIMKEKKDPKGNTDTLFRAKPKTINMFLSTTKTFFQQEYIMGHIAKNPMLHIKNIKVEKRKADYYTVQELKAFFAQPMDAAYRQTFMGLLMTGMRFSEMANLKWGSVNLESRTINIHSEGDFITKTHNGERIIPIGNDLFKLLKLMQKNMDGKELVFCSPKGQKLLERPLLSKCKKIADDAGIKANANLHKFRHTYATLLIHRGVPIQNIKELLGHSSILQTEIYAHNKSDHLHPDVARLNNLLKS